MEVRLYKSTGNSYSVEEMKKLAQVAARICYSDKDIDGLDEEAYNSDLVDGRLLSSGHHSPFEHSHLTFYMKVPKILAMVLNNERQYVTSEKSARFTIMKDMAPVQKELYDGWMKRIIPAISLIYPSMIDSGARDIAVKKLAQENARYITSVFTPTKMLHTINLRQLNFILNEFGSYVKSKSSSNNPFERKLSETMQEFLEQTLSLKIEGLENRTDRHLSIFNFEDSTNTFRDVYSTEYFMSFAGLAQAHRHRTISYNALTPEDEPLGFYTPNIIKHMGEEENWLSDLEEISQNDYPQAQLLIVRERGNIEDFRSKCLLRLCGHAQHEIMLNTKETAEIYSKKVPKVKGWTAPKCVQGFMCKEPCIWTGKKALERIV
jgi:thymidylate synthase ThyX